MPLSDQMFFELQKNDYQESFVFAVNIQVPGPRHFSIVYYYRLRAPLDKVIYFSPLP